MSNTKRHENTVLDVLARVQQGMPIKSAARAAGIDPTTWWRWRVADPDLDMACERARAVWLQTQVERIDQAASADWRAAAWLLSRSDRSNWGDRVDVKVEAEPQPIVDLLTGQVLAPVQAGSSGPVSIPGQVSGPGQGRVHFGDADSPDDGPDDGPEG